MELKTIMLIPFSELSSYGYEEFIYLEKKGKRGLEKADKFY